MLRFAKGSQEESLGKDGCLLKEQLNIYREHKRQPRYQQLTVIEHLHTFGDEKFHLFPFLRFFKKISH